MLEQRLQGAVVSGPDGAKQCQHWNVMYMLLEWRSSLRSGGTEPADATLSDRFLRGELS
jgi:hypothetical protein